jgi:hypothetical protein
MYQIPCSVYDLRTKVREQFEKNKHVTDVRVIDILILKGRQEFQESINYWKTPVRSRRPSSVGALLGDTIETTDAPLTTPVLSRISWAGSTSRRCVARARAGRSLGLPRRPVRRAAVMLTLALFLLPFAG